MFKQSIRFSLRHLSRLPRRRRLNTIVYALDEFDDTRRCAEIAKNVRRRKGIGDVEKIVDLRRRLATPGRDAVPIRAELIEQLRKLPNRTHPAIVEYGDEPRVVRETAERRRDVDGLYEFDEIVRRLNLVRSNELGNVAGTKSYYLLGDMARLEAALVRYTIDRLIADRRFRLVSVPDVLARDTIENCGMKTRGDRTQVYVLDSSHGADLCLSGTSEMALAGLFASKTIHRTELPIRLCTVSPCYRAETSSLAEERGIYRVHQFNKVEMFVICEPHQSADELESLRQFEERHFTALGLTLRTLDMPPSELGAPAYRKYDCEAWLPARGVYGEVSSCSNCTDYQSRRLSVRYSDDDGVVKIPHTLNGTACAVPRMLIALTETYQNVDDGTITVPEPLRRYMRNIERLHRQKSVPQLKLIKSNKK